MNRSIGNLGWLRSLRLVVAVVGASAITSYAILGSSTGAEAATKPLTGAQVHEAYDPALAKLVPAKYRATGGILSVASNATYPPDEYFTSDDTTIIGFDPDLAKGVGQILGLKLNIVDSPFDDIIPGLVSGRFDLGWSSASVTPTREDQVSFVTYFKAGISFMVPSGSKVHVSGLSSLCGLKVAVEAGSLEAKTVTAQSTKCTSEGKKAIAIQQYQTENLNVLALRDGRAEVSPAGSQIIPYLVHQSKGKLKEEGTAYDVTLLGVEFPKSAPTGLVDAFRDAINRMITNGSYGRILAYWGEQAGAITGSRILPLKAG